MATMLVYGIFSREYTSEKSGRQTVTLYDLEAKREISVGLNGQKVDAATLADPAPHHIQFEGLQSITYEGRAFLTCARMSEVAAPTAGRK